MSRNIEINIKQQNGEVTNYETLYPKTVSKNILYNGDDEVTVWDKLNNLTPSTTFEVGDILYTNKIINLDNNIWAECNGSLIEDNENLKLYYSFEMSNESIDFSSKFTEWGLNRAYVEVRVQNFDDITFINFVEDDEKIVSVFTKDFVNFLVFAEITGNSVGTNYIPIIDQIVSWKNGYLLRISCTYHSNYSGIFYLNSDLNSNPERITSNTPVMIKIDNNVWGNASTTISGDYYFAVQTLYINGELNIGEFKGFEYTQRTWNGGKLYYSNGYVYIAFGINSNYRVHRKKTNNFDFWFEKATNSEFLTNIVSTLFDEAGTNTYIENTKSLPVCIKEFFMFTDGYIRDGFATSLDKYMLNDSISATFIDGDSFAGDDYNYLLNIILSNNSINVLIFNQDFITAKKISYDINSYAYISKIQSGYYGLVYYNSSSTIYIKGVAQKLIPKMVTPNLTSSNTFLKYYIKIK